MRSARRYVLCVSAVVLAAAIEGGGAAARRRSRTIRASASRPGCSDAGEAARNMEQIASLPKPEGFFDPQSPAGAPTPPERDPKLPPRRPIRIRRRRSALREHARLRELGPRVQRQPRLHGQLPRLQHLRHRAAGQAEAGARRSCVPAARATCRSTATCCSCRWSRRAAASTAARRACQTPVSAERFRGVRIFDITDLNKPKQVAAMQTCRGSHTHTLVTDPNDKANLYVYGSGTERACDRARSSPAAPGSKPDEDPNTALFSIDVIQVPLAAPQNAKIVNRPRIFADIDDRRIAGLSKGGDQRPGHAEDRARPTSATTSRCSRKSAWPPAPARATASCSTSTIRRTRCGSTTRRDKNFAYWHSATFNNDGTKVIFTDEWGGGTRPRCRATDLPNWGADAIFDIVDRKLMFEGYYKMPAAQTEQENCVAHNGSLIPVPGRDIMVQAWYQGGVSVFDFTDSAHAGRDRVLRSRADRREER